MSSKRVSPTATLLRNSRLFSLPPPLPRPLNDFMGHVQSNKTSDTATVPYPIQQTVTTTRSAVARGDWGLKRALPLRSTTNTSTPLLRVNAVDTREHITDFESASDVSLNLQKFQELGLPITKHPSRQRASRPEARVSVFEPATDNTDSDLSKRQGYTRWKFHGPWVAGMTQGDFDAYVMKEVKHRKHEFIAYVRDYRLREMKPQVRLAAREAGEDIDAAEASADLSDADFEQYIRKLRSEFALNSTLATLVQRFLDLPTQSAHIHGSDFNLGTQDEGPNRTHPSAGLSYLRSDAYLNNHPLLGPQTHHTPVEARILVSPDRSMRTNADNNGKIGVAGVVTIAPPVPGRKSSVIGSVDAGEPKSSYGRSSRNTNTDVSLGLNIPGGNRIWVEPTSLGIDSRGRIELRASNAAVGPVKVHTGDFKDATVSRIKRLEPMPPLTDDIASTGQDSSTENRQQGNFEPSQDSKADLTTVKILAALEKSFAPGSAPHGRPNR